MAYSYLFLNCCLIADFPEQKEIEKYTVDGVEIIENQIKPYKIAEKLHNFKVEIELTIDTEEDIIANLGVTDIHGFDVDDDGSIYIFMPPLSNEALVHKFDKDGNYLVAFGKKGQGPGEVEYPNYQRITTDNKIPIVDGNRHKILIFDEHGQLFDEISFKGKIKHENLLFGMIAPLSNGNFLVRTLEGNINRSNDSSQTGVDNVLSLYDSNFKWIGKDIDRLHHSNRLIAMRSTHMMPVYFWDVFDEKIFIGNSQWGYEIRIFDLDGNLVKKVKKKYKPVKFSEEILEEFKRVTENPESRYYGLKRNFPNTSPHFSGCFSATTMADCM